MFLPVVGEIHDVWGYKFRWTSKHLTEEQLKPLLFTYDTAGAEVLERLHNHRLTIGESVIGASAKKDMYETLESMAKSKEDEIVNKFWKDVHTVPIWVDWDQIKRGQDVYYRYAEAMHIGGIFSGLLGGMGAARIAETLARTGGFSPRVTRKRLLETSQHALHVTTSLQSIQPGGEGHKDCLRVRLLHAAVRKRILSLAKTKPEYFDTDNLGIPINDQDTMATIATYSAHKIWVELPMQGIFLRPTETEDYIALWRLVAYYMGTPTDVFETVESAKAYMDSVLESDLKPSNSSKVLANNIITALVNQPPRYPSADYLYAQARWFNGPHLSDALDIPKSTYVSSGLVIVQCLVICFTSYFYRSIPILDKWRIHRMRRFAHKNLIEGKYGLNGEKTKFEMQYIPEYDTVTEKGEVVRREGFVERKGSLALVIAAIVPLGTMYMLVKLTINP